MRPLRQGGSHFVNAFWHGNQDGSDVATILVAMPKCIYKMAASMTLTSLPSWLPCQNVRYKLINEDFPPSQLCSSKHASYLA